MAGSRACGAGVRVRPRASVRSWAASRDRHRRGPGNDGNRAGVRDRFLRRNGAHKRKERDDRDRRRTCRDADASRLLHGREGRPGRRGRGGRNGRAERHARGGRPVRPPRHPRGESRPGVSRPAPVPALLGGGAVVRPRAATCGSRCLRIRPESDAHGGRRRSRRCDSCGAGSFGRADRRSSGSSAGGDGSTSGRLRPLGHFVQRLVQRLPGRFGATCLRGPGIAAFGGVARTACGGARGHGRNHSNGGAPGCSARSPSGAERGV
jgi:hypothetical protein